MPPQSTTSFLVALACTRATRPSAVWESSTHRCAQHTQCMAGLGRLSGTLHGRTFLRDNGCWDWLKLYMTHYWCHESWPSKRAEQVGESIKSTRARGGERQRKVSSSETTDTCYMRNLSQGYRNPSRLSVQFCMVALATCTKSLIGPTYTFSLIVDGELKVDAYL